MVYELVIFFCIILQLMISKNWPLVLYSCLSILINLSHHFRAPNSTCIGVTFMWMHESMYIYIE